MFFFLQSFERGQIVGLEEAGWSFHKNAVITGYAILMVI